MLFVEGAFESSALVLLCTAAQCADQHRERSVDGVARCLLVLAQLFAEASDRTFFDCCL